MNTPLLTHFFIVIRYDISQSPMGKSFRVFIKNDDLSCIIIVHGPRRFYSPCSETKHGHMHFSLGVICIPKTHFLQNSGVPFTVSDDDQSSPEKGTPEFYKKWVLGVHMTPKTKCIGPCFVSLHGE